MALPRWWQQSKLITEYQSVLCVLCNCNLVTRRRENEYSQGGDSMQPLYLVKNQI